MTDHPGIERDLEVFEAVVAVVPVWDGVAKASDVVGKDRRLLHAGPPISDPANMARPILNSAALATVYEGWSANPDDGEAMVMSGEIELAAAQDHGVVIPLAGIVSPSMTLQRVRDRNDHSTVAWSPFNGGMVAPMRLGLRDQAVADHWDWLDGVFASAIAPAIDPGCDLIGIARAGLLQGDDCHGRTPAATAALLEELRPRLDDAAAVAYLEQSPAFFLNLWMAASKCMLMPAVGATGCAIVTAAAGNGVGSGIQIAGLPGRWFTAPAAPPEGDIAEPYQPDDRLGAIGDSAIVDAFGLGAMAFAFAPEQRRAMAAHLPADALELPGKLLLGVHPGFSDLGLLVGQSASRNAALETSGLISLGILDKGGKGGRIGGGIYRPPVGIYQAASDALAAA